MLAYGIAESMQVMKCTSTMKLLIKKKDVQRFAFGLSFKY